MTKSVVTNIFRNRKHVPCCYRAIETQVEVWENKKCCGNMSRRCFHSFSEFSKTFHDVPLLTTRPWAERGSCSTHGFFNRAAMGQARFMVYPWFFFNLCASRPKLPLGQILSHATCDVYSPKAVETLINLVFHGKKLKTQCSSKIIFFHQQFSSEHIHIYIRLNRR